MGSGPAGVSWGAVDFPVGAEATDKTLVCGAGGPAPQWSMGPASMHPSGAGNTFCKKS